MYWHRKKRPYYETRLSIISEEQGNVMRKITLTIMALAMAVMAIPASAKTVTLKIATAAPEASSWVGAMRDSAAEIKERTEGRVVIKYYTGGVQGSDDQVRKKIKVGILDGGAFTPGALNTEYPDINLYSLPLVFQSTDEADFVRKLMDQKLIDGLAKKGYVSFGFAHAGFAMVMSNDPVRSVDDLKGKKVWVPEGDGVSYDTMKALGVSPQPLPLTDVMIGLQTKLIDIAPVSPLGALFLQWYTRIKYVTDMPLVYTFGFTVIDERKFNKIDPADQAIVKEVITRMYNEADKTAVEDNAGALEAILNKGVQLIPVNDEEMARIRKTIMDSNRALIDQGMVNEELYDEMLTHVQAYRDGKGGADEQVAAAAD